MPNLQQLNPGTPSLSEELGRNLGSGIGGGLAYNLQSHLQAKKNRSALSAFTPYLKQSGMSDEDIDSFVNSGLDPKIGSELVRAQLNKKQEDLGKFETGLQTISQMRDVLKRGRLGRGTNITRLFGAGDARDAAEYEQLGKSLIPIVAAGVPVRNQKEFEEYKKVLTDASSSQAEIAGALDGLEKILAGKLGSNSAQNQKESSVNAQESNAQQSDTVLMKDPSGALRKVPRNQAIEAQKHGYKLEQQ